MNRKKDWGDWVIVLSIIAAMLAPFIIVAWVAAHFIIKFW